MDTPGRYKEGKIPMLNVQVWTEPTKTGNGTIICYTFFEKAVISPLVFHNRGARSVKQKILILAKGRPEGDYTTRTHSTFPKRYSRT